MLEAMAMLAVWCDSAPVIPLFRCHDEERNKNASGFRENGSGRPDSVEGEFYPMEIRSGSFSWH
jgi:hypothetical protein